MEDTTGARSVKLKCPFPSFDGPPMCVEDWAAVVFDVEAKTILDWVKRHNILNKQFGRQTLIEPRYMWECVPYSNEAPPAPPKAKKLPINKRKA